MDKTSMIASENTVGYYSASVIISDDIKQLWHYCLCVSIGMTSLGSLKSKYTRHSFTVSLLNQKNKEQKSNYNIITITR